MSNADSLALTIYTDFIESYFRHPESIKYIRSQRYKTPEEFRKFLVINKPVSRAWNSFKSHLPGTQQRDANIFIVRSMGNDQWWSDSKRLKAVLSNLNIGNESVSNLTSQFNTMHVSPNNNNNTQPSNSSNSSNQPIIFNTTTNNQSVHSNTNNHSTNPITITALLGNLPPPTSVQASMTLFNSDEVKLDPNSSTSGKTQTSSSRFTKDFIVEATKHLEPALKAILQSKYSDRTVISAKIAEFKQAASQTAIAYVHFENYTPTQKKDAYRYAKMILGYLYVIVQSDQITENQVKLISKLTDLIKSKFISQ